MGTSKNSITVLFGSLYIGEDLNYGPTTWGVRSRVRGGHGEMYMVHVAGREGGGAEVSIR